MDKDIFMCNNKIRCDWNLNTEDDNDLYLRYHDDEWGVPVYDDVKLFEFLVLEGMQAGLSWINILKKRENFRRAFDDFDIEKIANYDENKVNSLMCDKGIVRNHLKIKSVINNALAYQRIIEKEGKFSNYIWNFVDGKPINNKWKSIKQVPAETELSKIVSKDLKSKGFKFVGPVICYSFMQAVGLVNDHILDCFRYKDILEIQKK